MSTFVPCRGMNACRDDGEKCLVCGRSLAEIMETRRHIDALMELALARGYENGDEFAAYVASRLAKKIRAHGQSVE